MIIIIKYAFGLLVIVIFIEYELVSTYVSIAFTFIQSDLGHFSHVRFIWLRNMYIVIWLKRALKNNFERSNEKNFLLLYLFSDIKIKCNTRYYFWLRKRVMLKIGVVVRNGSIRRP